MSSRSGGVHRPIKREMFDKLHKQLNRLADEVSKLPGPVLKSGPPGIEAAEVRAPSAA